MRTSRPINNITSAPSIPDYTDDLTDEEMEYLAEETAAYNYYCDEMAEMECEKAYRDSLVAQHRKETSTNGEKKL